MRTVYKYPFSILKPFTLHLPSDWEPVLVAEQDGQPCLWVELLPDAPSDDFWYHTFQVFGTGHDLPKFGSHIGSWQSPPYVWHLYQLGSTK